MSEPEQPEQLEPESLEPAPEPAPEPLAPWVPTIENPGLEHSRQGDVWSRHADGPQRDRDADRDTRREIRQEMAGEYDSEGFRRSSWSSNVSQSTNEWF